MLGRAPALGRSPPLSVLDPATMKVNTLRVAIQAETSIVVHDSAVFDSISGRWHGVRPDTVRAWRLSTDGPPAFWAWVDAQGRVVQTVQFGLRLVRKPYEVAFGTWHLDS